MKREFLKNLGIEDKEIIDQILDENSADIGRAKGEMDTYKTRIQELESQLSAKTTEVDDLQKKAGDTTALNQRIAELEAEKTTLTNEMNTKVSEIQKTHAIEGGIRDAKGRNTKAIMALLDMGKITYENGVLTGLTEQLETLAGAEDSSMLFGDGIKSPAGTKPGNPPQGGGNPSTTTNLADAVAKALGTK